MDSIVSQTFLMSEPKQVGPSKSCGSQHGTIWQKLVYDITQMGNGTTSASISWCLYPITIEVNSLLLRVILLLNPVTSTQ